MNFLRKHFKTVLVTLIVSSLSFSPFSYIYAQGLGGATSGGTLSGGIKFGQSIADVLSCAGITPGAAIDAVGNAVSGVLDGGPGSSAVDAASDVVSGDLAGAAENLADAGAVELAQDAGTEAAGTAAQPVQDLVTRRNTKKTQREAEKAAENTKWQIFKENCLDQMVRNLAVRTLNRVTLATVEWINSGYDKEAFFLRNPEQFLTDLAQDEIMDFRNDIYGDIDGDLQPFGRTIERTIIASLRRKFRQNVTTSMQAVLNGIPQSAWAADFTLGGWSAYTAYVEPNNNIFGTYLNASQEIGRRISGSTQRSKAWDVQAELQRGLGYLAQKKCVATLAGGDLPYLDSDQPLHMPAGTSPIYQAEDIPPDQLLYIENELDELFEEDQVFIAETARKQSICTQWETLTPGSWIMNTANSATTDTTREQLISADEWNENLGLIFDAVILQAFEGLVGLYNPEGNYSSNPGDPNYNAAWAAVNDPNFGNSYTQTNANPEFFDVNNFNQILSTQQEYQSLLIDVMNQIILMVERNRELDYCVPGPYPGWYDNVVSNIEDGAFYLTEAPIGDLEDIQNHYASLLSDIVGASVDAEQANITSSQELQSILVDMFNQYSSVILEEYDNSQLPQNRQTAVSLYNLMTNSYQPLLQALATEYGYVADNVSTLEGLSQEVNNLLQDGSINANDPQAQQIQNQIQNMSYLVVEEDINDLQDSFDSNQGIINQVTQQRDSCIAQVQANDYPGLNYRKEYPVELSNAINVLDQHDSFLEDVLIAPGDANIYPISLPAGSISGAPDLSAFEEFLGPLF